MRGWGPEAFARAKPEFMEAVRIGLYAEKALPVLSRLREIQAVKVSKDTQDLPAVLAAKNEAAALIPQLEAILYPEDGVG